MSKSIFLLVPEDFHLSLIWQPVDDLEDPEREVAPFLGNAFHMEEMYLIATKFILADGSEREGYVRYSWGEPITMALAVSKNEFLQFGAGRLSETEESHTEFAAKLGKKPDDVFPIEYQTKVKVSLNSTVY
jgi:hypothetical protein